MLLFYYLFHFRGNKLKIPQCYSSSYIFVFFVFPFKFQICAKNTLEVLDFCNFHAKIRGLIEKEALRQKKNGKFAINFSIPVLRKRVLTDIQTDEQQSDPIIKITI